MYQSEAMPYGAPPRVRGVGFFVMLAFAALIFGGKLWLIGAYGNATPYWDQWSGEAAFLYKPFLAGTLGWAELVAPHNEHRILTTRLLDMALLKINGIWNPLLQMVVNAVLHVITLCLLMALLARTVGREQTPVLLAFALVLFGLPCAWENTLCAFQAQFYFVLLFGIACLWLTTCREPLSAAWWGGLACGMLAFLSFGSGICAPATAAVVALTLFATGVRSTRRQLLAAAILAGTTALAAAITPSLFHHGSSQAVSIGQLLHAWTSILGWPFSYRVYMAPIVYLPALILIGVLVWKRPPARDHTWFLLALVLWAFAQDATIAFGRAGMIENSRYLDLYSIGVLASCACAVWLAQDRTEKKYAWRIPAAAIWAAAILVSLATWTARRVPVQLAEFHTSKLAQEANTRAYVHTGDFKHLQDKPPFHVPYPNRELLASWLSDAQIRAILPSNVRADARRGRLDRTVTQLVQSYSVFLAGGVAIIFVLLIRRGVAGRIAAENSRIAAAFRVEAMQVDPAACSRPPVEVRLTSPSTGVVIDVQPQHTKVRIPAC